MVLRTKQLILNKALLLVKFFLVLKVIFFKINEKATLPEMEKEKKIKKKEEGDRGERKRLGMGKGKGKDMRTKKKRGLIYTFN